MKAIKWLSVTMVLVFPAYAQAGFITGAVVGGAAGKMACVPYQKELACIKEKLKDPAWKGKESTIIDACEPKKRERLPMKQPEQTPAQPTEQQHQL